jgi:hypothetical protein
MCPKREDEVHRAGCSAADAVTVCDRIRIIPQGAHELGSEEAKWHSPQPL